MPSLSSNSFTSRSVRAVLHAVFGDRAWRPYSFGLSVVSMAVAVAILTDQTVLGHLLTGGVGLVVASAAVGTSLLLTIGWWARRHRLIENGLFLSIGVWGAISALLVIDAGFWNMLTWFAIPWVLISSGSWWLEVHDRTPT